MSKQALRNLIVIVATGVLWGLWNTCSVTKEVHLGLTPRDICLTQLHQIQSAKEFWASKNNMPTNAMPMEQDLLPYLSEEVMPRCPGGGKYSINAVAIPASCSITNHVLQ